MLIYGDDAADWDQATAEAVDRYQDAHVTFAEVAAERALTVRGEALHGVASATTMRHRDGVWTMTDGPVTEAPEHLSGFYVLDVPDLDALAAMCESLPAIYALELRPVADPGHDPTGR